MEDTKIKAVETLLYIIGKTKEELLIVSGELAPRVFNNDDVIAGLENLVNNGVKVQIQTGPIIYGDNEGINKTYEYFKKVMQEKGKEEAWLMGLKERPTPHFRIADNILLWVEEPHPFGYVDKRQIKKIENSFFEARRYRDEFINLKGQSHLFPDEIKVIPSKAY